MAPQLQQPPDQMNPSGTPQIVAALRVHAVPIDDLRPQQVNPRIGDVDVLRGSLRVFGQRRPATYRKGGEISAGSTLWRAAKAEGMTHFAAVMVDDDDATARAWSLADNRSHDVGTYDDQLLERELEVLARDFPHLVDAAGWDADEVIADLALDELDLDDPDPQPPSAPAGRGFVPGRKKQPDPDPDQGADAVADADPVASSPRPPAVDSGADTPVDSPGPDSGGPRSTPGWSPADELDAPDDEPVLFHLGDLRALVDRPTWNTWRAELMAACDDDRAQAGVSAVVLLLGCDPELVRPVPDPVPPIDRHR